MLRRILFPALVLAVGCSSSSKDDANANDKVGTIKGAEVWKGSVTLNGPIIIGQGADVEIAAGAQITCSANGSLYVQGKLHARAAAQHAKITCPSWGGIAVDTGGAIDLEGVEIENAVIAIATIEGALESRYAEGVITSATHPFSVAKNTKLTVEKTKSSVAATLPAGVVANSEIFGTLVTSYLDYDAGKNDGIVAKDGGQLDISDSTFTGAENDLVASYGGKSVKVAYSTFKAAHCGLHIQPADSFTIDHVTADDAFGITIYASGAGPNTVSNSNFTGSAAWLDFQGDNGPITFNNVFVSGQEIMKGGPPPTINQATAAIPDAKPR
jgi:hypothetical protein